MSEEVENRYKNGKIYKLVSNIDDEFYIGSTCLLLSKRLAYHKSHAKEERQMNRPVYLHFNKIGMDNAKIILIENYSCDNKEQLVSRERYWYDQLHPTLNGCRPFATDEENKEKAKEYYKNNPDKQIERHKKYYENNQDKIIEYREANKDKLKEWRSQIWHCDVCNSDLQLGGKARHIKGKNILLIYPLRHLLNSVYF